MVWAKGSLSLSQHVVCIHIYSTLTSMHIHELSFIFWGQREVAFLSTVMYVCKNNVQRYVFFLPSQQCGLFCFCTSLLYTKWFGIQLSWNGHSCLPMEHIVRWTTTTSSSTTRKTILCWKTTTTTTNNARWLLHRFDSLVGWIVEIQFGWNPTTPCKMMVMLMLIAATT